MNATDDDGLMSQHTIGTVIRMGQNMPGHVKVRGIYLTIPWRVEH